MRYVVQGLKGPKVFTTGGYYLVRDINYFDREVKGKVLKCLRLRTERTPRYVFLEFEVVGSAHIRLQWLPIPVLATEKGQLGSVKKQVEWMVPISKFDVLKEML